MSGARRWAVVVAIVLAAGCSGDGGESDRSAPEPSRVRIVSQNLLHGVACAPESDGCDLPSRVALFAQQLDEQGCPDLVSVQEANDRMVSLLEREAPQVCDGEYEIVWDDDPGLDREVVLSRMPVLGSQRTRLAGPLRTALWVRAATGVGVVDFVSTHLASGSDDRPCDRETCPPPCSVDDTLNTCQARQVVDLADDVAADDSVVVIAGDLNAEPGEPAIDALVDGGYTDTHLAAGNDECDSDTGAQCTSGRADDSLTDLTDPASRQSERIDYVFVGGTRACDVVGPTGLFNGEPATSTAGELAFAADHTAVEATLECETSSGQRAASVTATVSSAPPTTSPPESEVDTATQAAITDAFSTVFDGDVTDVEQKLAALEDGEILREFFLATYEAQRPIASQVRVRLDAVTLVDATNADVTYTLLLDGNAVLDHLPGAAVKVGDRWLVTRRTFCDVSTQGQEEIPPACQ
jgi:endonuclease/exonuclease/phosphatase family metal-dependent hydrolase